MTDVLLRGLRLLVVEDDYLLGIEVAAALEDAGAEIVGLVASLEEAKEVIDAEGDRLDGAVLDVNLGGDRVYPVADALAARKVPFIFATGYDLSTIPEAYAAIPCCEKPLRADALAGLLARQINSPGSLLID